MKSSENLPRTKLAGEHPGQTLQATALVHDAWLELDGSNHDWNNRGHFFAAAPRPNIVFIITDATGHQIGADYTIVTNLP